MDGTKNPATSQHPSAPKMAISPTKEPVQESFLATYFVGANWTVVGKIWENPKESSESPNMMQQLS